MNVSCKICSVPLDRVGASEMKLGGRKILTDVLLQCPSCNVGGWVITSLSRPDDYRWNDRRHGWSEETTFWSNPHPLTQRPWRT